MDHIQDAEIIQEKWDKRKIFAGIIGLLVLIFAFYQNRQIILGTVSSSGKVAGASTQKNVTGEQTVSPLPLQKDAQESIQGLLEEAKGVKLDEIASSSAQIQKVLNDLKALGNYPKDQVRQVCQNICGK